MKKAKKVKKKGRLRQSYDQLIDQIRSKKSVFTVYLILRLTVILVMVRCIFARQYESVFVCLLTLLLFLMPSFLERSLSIRLPNTLEIIAMLFIFSAEILGEIGSFYVKVPIWDTMLHTTNGFLFAAVGFALVDLLNENKRFRFELSPMFLTVVAFCFSMTIGVLWEFFEFGADQLLRTDMQKDFLVQSFSSVTLDPTRNNIPVRVDSIIETIIVTAGGATYNLPGYLDIGIADTMKDLLVNFIGAVIFCIFGYFYVCHRGKGKLASWFIPVSKKVAELRAQEESSLEGDFEE